MKFTIGGNNSVMVSPGATGPGKMNGSGQNLSGKAPPGRRNSVEQKPVEVVPAKVPAVSVQSGHSQLPTPKAAPKTEIKPEPGRVLIICFSQYTRRHNVVTTILHFIPFNMYLLFWPKADAIVFLNNPEFLAC